MGLEDDIKQTRPFKDEMEKVIVNVVYTNNWIVDNLQCILKEYGLTRSQYNILRILAGANLPMSTADIRLRMLEKMSDITRLIDRMIKKGWVTKSTRDSDKRRVDIELTDEGRSLLTQISALPQPIHSFAKELSLSEAQDLNRLLDKLRT